MRRAWIAASRTSASAEIGGLSRPASSATIALVMPVTSRADA
jgi:hypothetical protein